MVEWGEYLPGRYQYYFWWKPNWLDPDVRHLGVTRMWIDGPHIAFGFWWFNLSWSTARSLPPPEFMRDDIRAKWKARPFWLRKLFGLLEYGE